MGQPEPRPEAMCQGALSDPQSGSESQIKDPPGVERSRLRADPWEQSARKGPAASPQMRRPTFVLTGARTGCLEPMVLLTPYSRGLVCR